MKKTYIICGHLQIEYEVFISLLKSFLISSNVKDRYASGIEKTINYKDKNVDIYIYEDDQEYFLFNAEYRGALTEVEEFMKEFNTKLMEHSIPHYQFQWNEYDDDGNHIGEEFEIKFPSDEQSIA